MAREVGGQIVTSKGDIELTDGARVRGGIHVKKNNGNNWGWGKDEPLKVHICSTCVVDGELRFDRPVELRVDDGAKIGKVIGDYGHAPLNRLTGCGRTAAPRARRGASQTCVRRRIPNFSSTRIDAVLPCETTAMTRCEAEFPRAVTHRGLGRLEGKPLSPEFRQECVTDVDVRQVVALEQPAHADGSAVRLARDVPQAEAVLFVHRHRPLAQVAMRVFDGAHAAIADVLDERRLVEQLHDEWRVVEFEAAQREPRGLELRKDRQIATARKLAAHRRISPSRCRR